VFTIASEYLLKLLESVNGSSEVDVDDLKKKITYHMVSVIDKPTT
jgi:hypothetical protein